MRRLAHSALLAACLLTGAYACDSNTKTVPPGSGGSGGTSSTGGSGGTASRCLGIEPPAEAFDAEPGPQLTGGMGGAGGSGGAGGASLAPTEVGADAPVYQLRDFQPQSCGYQATYGLEQFRGKPTFVALWAGW